MVENQRIDLLIVDGKMENREDISNYLEQKGYSITIAQDENKALDLIRIQDFDLMLLDINSPESGVFKALEHIMTDNALQDISAVVLVPENNIEIAEECLKMGAEDYINRPFSPALLEARLDNSLRKRKLHSQMTYYLKEKREAEKLANDLLSVILPLGTTLSAESDFDRLTERIIHEFMSLCNADVGILYLLDQDDRLEPVAMINKTLGLNLGGTTGAEVPLPGLPIYDPETEEPNCSKIITCALMNDKTIAVPDVQSAAEFDFSDIVSLDKENNYRSISCLALPLKSGKNEILGALQLINAQDQRTDKVIPFSSYAQQAASALAIQSSIILNNQILLRRQEELLKFAQELQIGQDIQKSFLPDELPEFPGWEIGAHFDPARNVGGDFYDAFPLTQNRRLGFVIADVCDKGVGAALFMGLIRSLIRAFSQQHHSLSWMDSLSDSSFAPQRGRSGRRNLPSVGIGALKNGVLLTSNYIANNHGESSMFATLFFGMLDPASGMLAYINGGHEPPIVIGADGVKKAELDVTGPAVGVFPDMEFNIRETQLEPGDILFSYTDGVTDAESPDDERFGKERLFELLEQPVTGADDLLKRVEAGLRSHIAQAEQFDDITMLAVRREKASEV